MIKKLFALILVAVISSCAGKNEPAERKINPYFDVAGYFDKEILRLNKIKPSVNKTVEIDGSAERKRLKIKDWNKELDIFKAAAINKKSWEGLFTVKKTANAEIYLSASEKAHVKRLEVYRLKGRIAHITIIIQRTNLLYVSSDTLNYFPDSLYSIRKSQKIKLLPGKRYTVTGEF